MNGVLWLTVREKRFARVQILLSLEMTQRVKLAAFILSHRALWHKKASKSNFSATATPILLRGATIRMALHCTGLSSRQSLFNSPSTRLQAPRSVVQHFERSSNSRDAFSFLPAHDTMTKGFHTVLFLSDHLSDLVSDLYRCFSASQGDA